MCDGGRTGTFVSEAPVGNSESYTYVRWEIYYLNPSSDMSEPLLNFDKLVYKVLGPMDLTPDIPPVPPSIYLCRGPGHLRSGVPFPVSVSDLKGSTFPQVLSL